MSKKKDQSLGIVFEEVALSVNKDNAYIVDNFINDFLGSVKENTLELTDSETPEPAFTFKNIKVAKEFYSRQGNQRINEVLKEMLKIVKSQ